MSLAVPQPPATGVATAPEGTHDCYLNYISTTQLRLDRFGGNRIMCNGVREVIPAGGVPYIAGTWAAGSVFNVWCGPTGGVAGAGLYLVGDTPDPVIDAYGMPVHPAVPFLTLVGRFYSQTNAFLVNSTLIGVVSYWNRRYKAIAASNSQTTASTSPVELHGGNRLIAVGWPGDPVICMVQGCVINDSIAYTYARIEQAGVGAMSQLGQHHATVPNAYGTLCLEYDAAMPAAGYLTTALTGYVNAGTGTWLPNCSMLVRG